MLVKLPFPEEGRSDKETIQNLYDVVLRLRKELEYQMAHLDSENVTSLDADITEIKNLKAEQIFTNIITSITAITDVLYAQEGRIARLTVDHLLTEDVLDGNATMYYIDIEDQYIKFITAVRNDALPQIQYTTENDELLYWDSAAHEYLTTLVTDYPTMVYQYDRYDKMKLFFDETRHMGVPYIGMGIGDGVTEMSGKFEMVKDIDGLMTNYYERTTGELRQIKIGDYGIEISAAAETGDTTNLTIGLFALYQWQDKDFLHEYNVVLGSSAMYSPDANTYSNVAVGEYAFYSFGHTYLTWISGNIAIGLSAGENAYGDIYVGLEMFNNIFMGVRAGRSSQCNSSIAIGKEALDSCGILSQSEPTLDVIAIGNYAGDTQKGSKNIFIGHTAGKYVNSNDNLVIGNQIGNDITTALINGEMGSVKADQRFQINGQLRLSLNKTPASATATGTKGDVAWDSDYIYICVATDTWKRTALSTW